MKKPANFGKKLELKGLKRKMNRLAKKVGFYVFLFLLFFTTFAIRAEAYTYYMSLPKGKYSIYYNWTGGYAVGYNVTQGYAQNLPISVDYSSASVTVPDDGCTWKISGFVMGSIEDSLDGTYEPVYQTFSTTVTTSGTFSGYSPKTATDAANVAATNAQNAYNAANSAAINAQNAYNAANTAKSSADTAASRVWDSSEGKSAATLAKEARDKANEAITAVNNMQTIITDIKNTVTTDNVPPSVEVKTLSGATATSGSSIRLVIAASDNKSANLNYNVNGGAYSPLPADGKVSVPLTSPGPNTIVIGVQD
ncbi:hypothetical protein NZJ93_14885, partial [Desulfofundulus thermocisternus]|nr:hypothetical protein [Desulfofundulus thermocisternus]